MYDLSINFRSVNIERQVIDAINNHIKKNKRRILASVHDKTRNAFRYAVNTIYPIEVARYAPNPSEERDALSEGIDERGRHVGSSDSARFMKSGFKYLQQAIIDDLKMSMRSSIIGDGINFEFYIPSDINYEINREIGFGWIKKTGKHSLEKRATTDSSAFNPTWRNLLNIWEYGGTYTVKPRDAGQKLSPGPDSRIRSAEVTKTIKARLMFKQAKMSSRNKIINMVKNSLLKRYI